MTPVKQRAASSKELGILFLHCTLRTHKGVVWTVSWSSQGLLASGGADGAVYVYREKDGVYSTVASVSNNVFRRTVRNLSWACDGRSLAVACFDGVVTVLELMGGKAPKLDPAVALEGHENETKGVAYSSSGGLLATCSRDRSVWIWEVGMDFDYECIAVLNGHAADVKSVAWHPRCELLVSSSYDNTAKVWVEDEDDWFCSETLGAHDSTVWAVAFDAEGQRLATVSADSSMVVWSREPPPPNVIGAQPSFRVVARNSNLHDGPVYSVDWNTRNDLIATGGGDDSICILQRSQSINAFADEENTDAGAPNGEEERALVTPAMQERWEVAARVPRAHTGDVNQVAWNPADSNILASCGDDGLVRIWSLSDDTTTARGLKEGENVG